MLPELTTRSPADAAMGGPCQGGSDPGGAIGPGWHGKTAQAPSRSTEGVGGALGRWRRGYASIQSRLKPRSVRALACEAYGCQTVLWLNERYGQAEATDMLKPIQANVGCLPDSVPAVTLADDWQLPIETKRYARAGCSLTAGNDGAGRLKLPK